MSAFAALPQSATYVSQGFFLFKLYFVSGPFMDNAVTNLLLSRVILLFSKLVETRPGECRWRTRKGHLSVLIPPEHGIVGGRAHAPGQIYI